jgi:hypothetical protein
VTEALDSANEPVAANQPVPAPKRSHWQIGLRTILLFMAAIAAWMTYVANRQHNAWLRQRITALRPLARELVIDDETQIAVVKLEELWYDENRWELYLPPGEYRLCVATHNIDRNGLAPVVTSTLLKSGRHSLALEQAEDQAGWHARVTSDGSGRLVVDEPKVWNPGHGSSGGSQISVSTQLPANQPAVLFRRVYMRPFGKGGAQSPSGPSNGILLWIEPKQ